MIKKVPNNLDDTTASMTMSMKKLKLNFALVTISILLNMSAFKCLEGLQSSVNEKSGTQALSALYLSGVVTSLFLPTLAMDLLKNRKAMGLATLAYPVYTLANCYPRPILLIASACILGSAGSVMWASTRVYISDISNAYATLTKSTRDKVTVYFFGIFWTVYSSSMLIANAVSSAVLQSYTTTLRYEYNQTATDDVPSLITTTIRPKHDAKMVLRCGMHNCDETGISENSTMPETDQRTQPEVNKVVLYVLFAVFAFLQICAGLVMIFAMDDAPTEDDNDTLGRLDQAKSHLAYKHTMPKIENNNNSLELCDETHELENKTLQEQVVEDDMLSRDSIHKKSRKHRSTTKRVKRQVLATAKLVLTNRVAAMLIPLTLHVGMLQGFVFAQFTKHWIACVLGIEYIGYGVCAFGVGSMIGSYAVGLSTQVIPRWVALTVASLTEVAVLVSLMVWNSEKDSGTAIFLIIIGVFGILHAVNKTTLTTIYSLFFQKDKEPANAAFCLWDPSGSAIAYAVSATICNFTFIILLLVLVGTGTLLYIGTESIYTSQRSALSKNLEWELDENRNTST